MHEWTETLSMRRAALGKEYKSYLGKCVLTWAGVLGGFLLVLSVGRWVRGTHRWFQPSDLAMMSVAATVGAVVRLALELIPRTVTVRGGGVLIDHPGVVKRHRAFNHVRVEWVNPALARVSFEWGATKCKSVTVGAPAAAASQLEQTPAAV